MVSKRQARSGGWAVVSMVAFMTVVAASVPGFGQEAGSAPANEQQPPTAQTDQAAPNGEGIRFVWANDRPSLRLWNDTVHIDFRARLRGDVISDGVDPEGSDAFDLRRRRIGVSGAVGRRVDFQIERELWSDRGWRDFFVNVRLATAAQVKVGQFKLPFSMDELTSASSLDFVFRSLAASALAPARDVGAMVHGRTAMPGSRSRMEYELGLFRHDGDNARLGPLTRLTPGADSTVARRTVAGRLQISPFDRSARSKAPGGTTAGDNAKNDKGTGDKAKSDEGTGDSAKGDKAKAGKGRAKSKGPLEGLRFGAAATVNRVPAGDNGLRGQDALSRTFFPRIDVSGQRLRVGFEASWRYGPATIRSEVIRVRDQRRGQGVTNEDLPDVVATGWYLQGTWALLGGKRRESTARWLGRGGIGDVELAARAERLRFGSAGTGGEAPLGSPRAANLASSGDTVATFGINWRPVPIARMQVNVIRDVIEGFPWTSRDRQDKVWNLVASFQLAF